MIVDSTALIEQVVDDVLASAFRSAGQRCSALRLLCVQEEIAPACLDALIGASSELRVGDPREIGVHVGPVIDAEAKERLELYLARQADAGRLIYAGVAPHAGTYVAPHIVRVDRIGDLREEVEARMNELASRAPAGNIYVNRNMIGAVVGSQPFGGFGLSGTGPTAGGPEYLRRFLREATVTINTASSGGDAGLLSLEE